MDFSDALRMLKAGRKIARAGWNGKGMWLCLGEGRTIDADDFWNKHTHAFAHNQPERKAEVLPYIVMKTADDKVLMGWLASQTDLLAEDWCVVI